MPGDHGPEVLRYAAFTHHPDGGNPAGVVLDATGLDAVEMQKIAALVGYSETAFLIPRGESRRAFDVRYFTPEVEVPFCGHATIAAAVALARRDGPSALELQAPAGVLRVLTRADEEGRLLATLETVTPTVEGVDAALLQAALAALRWDLADLDPGLPPRVAFAGARHLVLAVGTRERLSDLDYDYDALAGVARRLGLITLALVWREDEVTFHARNPGPSVGILEDPATGAAAAALGAYLVALGKLAAPARITVHQGQDMGRPSRLLVDLDPARTGVLVSGSAVLIPGDVRPRH